MLTFDRLPMDENLYKQMLDDLINAIKYTCEVEKFNLEQQAVVILYKIISEGEYGYITEKNNFRYNMKKYNPTQFFNLLMEYTEMVKNYNFSQVQLVDNKYAIDDFLLFTLCQRMCTNYIIKMINESEPNNDKQSDNYQASEENEEVVYHQVSKVSTPEEIVYYRPSNKCYEAIMTKTQTSVKNSSYESNGMMGFSHVGNLRSNQEDSYYLGVHPDNNNFKIMVVADGVGGHERGEVASNLAVRGIIEWFEKLNASEYYNHDNNVLEKSINFAVQDINQMLHAKTDGATTLCMAMIKNNSIVMVNIGDSKGYVIENNRLIFSTFQEDNPHSMGIPEPLTRFHKENNLILNFLGGYSDKEAVVNIDILPLKYDCYYKIIVCSDGVVDCLGDRKIVDIVNNHNNSAQALVECALKNESSLKEELQRLSFFARNRVKRSDYYPLVTPGKDNATAIVGEFGRRR